MNLKSSLKMKFIIIGFIGIWERDISIILLILIRDGII